MKPTLAIALLVALSALPQAAGAGGRKTAVFAGGCYWTLEKDMEHIPGVTNVVAGFVPFEAGHPARANRKLAHAYEAVRVTYDPARVSYRDLAAQYLRRTDPTDAAGAFCDRGANYSPAIFVADAQERAAAQAVLSEAQPRLKRRIVTKVLPASIFRPAPEDQQDWARKNASRYAQYRANCGKDRAMKAIWGR